MTTGRKYCYVQKIIFKISRVSKLKSHNDTRFKKAQFYKSKYAFHCILIWNTDPLEKFQIVEEKNLFYLNLTSSAARFFPL